jgi:uncharacterized protein YgiM (DUF1202 family)
MKKKILMIAMIMCISFVLIACAYAQAINTDTVSNIDSSHTESTEITHVQPEETTARSTDPTRENVLMDAETIPAESDSAPVSDPTLSTEPANSMTIDAHVVETQHEHTYKNRVVSPTCNERGYTEHVCACGESYIDHETDTLQHEYVFDKIVEATCSKEGYARYKCERCGHTRQDNKTAKLAHKYTSKIVEPTCTQAGHILYTCACGYAYQDNVAGSALGHDYSTKTVAPTKDSKGYDIHTCTRCSKSYKNNYKDPVITYTEVNETVYAKKAVNIRTGPSTDYEIVGSLKSGKSITRVGIGDNGWSKVLYNDEVAYMSSKYLQTDKPATTQSSGYPMVYSDSTATITIYKEWYKNAYVYAAHIQFTDYKRFGTDCANGKYNNGYETTSHAAKRLGAIFAVNGCYSAPSLDYTVVRGGKIWNGSGRARFWVPAIYSFNNGKFLCAYDSHGTPGISGGQVDQLVADGLVTDTFCFGPPSLANGKVLGKNEGARAQRTFIGTNGNAGDIWVCVSDGRYNDGKSAGLTCYEAAEYLTTKGCTFGVHLDGGGSSTMYFNGEILNAAKGNQRSVVDFVYFK